MPLPSPEPQGLLAWYDRHARVLPWRVSPSDARSGVRPDPYAVWLSEIMLQQTTVTAVTGYYRAFLGRWPTLADLAAAEEDDVLKAWAGLGYYSRARNLKACADAVMRDHGGKFPSSAEGLRTLPGVGDYTSAAIAAIAFGEPVAVVDGNVERVVARLFAIADPLPGAKRTIRARTQALTPPDRPGDFAQAMMDLGATVCTPRRPSCMVCPFREACLALAGGDPERFPVKPAKPDKPLRRGAAFVAVAPDGSVLLEKRPSRGLLASMSQPPMTGWTARADGATDLSGAPFPAAWTHHGDIRHVFTHFELLLDVWRTDMHAAVDMPGRWWSSPADLASEALPSVMRKAIATALPDVFPTRIPERSKG